MARQRALSRKGWADRLCHPCIPPVHWTLDPRRQSPFPSLPKEQKAQRHRTGHPVGIFDSMVSVHKVSIAPSAHVRWGTNAESQDTRAVARHDSLRRLKSSRRPWRSRSLSSAFVLQSNYVSRVIGRCRAESRADDASPGFFPAVRQTRIPLSSVLLWVDAEEIVQGPSLTQLFHLEILPLMTSGVIAGVVVDSAGASTGALYEAVMAVKEQASGQSLSSKLIVLVMDRTDVASGAGVDGVVLGVDGLPVVVAKNQLGEGKVVGKVVRTSEAASRAAVEGAGMVVIDDAGAQGGANGGERRRLVEEVRLGQVSGGSVPVVGMVGRDDNDSWKDTYGLDGVLVRYREGLSREVLEGLFDGLSSPGASPEASSEAQGVGNDEAMMSVASNSASDSPATMLSGASSRLVSRQKSFLEDLIRFLSATTPSLEEVALLRDSLKQLDELFLVVIVGEFNAGKSAVVNAMLGGDTVVPEGILPTTNEITVIKYAQEGDGKSGTLEQDVDGLFVRYTAAELLKEVNIVDTPGTNVILERQQRLTEEFIPRADLVLFVLSADRPFTESEVKFLKYVRQWGKKVVFVVNKIDLLGSSEEVNQVVAFVEKNATRLLGVEGAKAIPVSAKLATQAKIETRRALGDGTRGNTLTDRDRSHLRTSDSWKASRFESLETFIREFLLGGPTVASEAMGAGVGMESAQPNAEARPLSESLRLKLQTPLFVADALIGAARTQIEAELSVLRRDEESVRMVASQLEAFRDEMSKEAKVQKAEIVQQTDRMVDTISNVVDQVLTLSNWQALLPYYTGKSKSPSSLGGKVSAALSAQDVSKDAMGRVNSIVEEHREWLRVNCQRVRENYRGFVAERMEVYNNKAAAPASNPSNPTNPASSASNSNPVTIDMRTIAAVLETEIQTAVKSSVNTFASAIVFSLLLTSILPTTLEDLLAIGLGASFAYASVLNIPVRRMEAKKKVRDEIRRLVKAVHDDMDAEERVRMDECVSTVNQLIGPLDSLLRSEISRLSEDVDALNTRYNVELDAIRGNL